MAELSVQAGDGSRERFPLAKDRVRIGRSRQSDIILADPCLSRNHAEILHKDDGFYILDLGSTNGTRVNGELVQQEQRLEPGDRIVLGEYVLTFSWDEPVSSDEDIEGEEFFAVSVHRLSDLDTKDELEREVVARQNRVLDVLTRAARGLTASWSLDDLFDHVLEQLFEAIPAERGAILLLEGEPPALVVKACRSCEAEGTPRISQSIARRVLQQQVSVLLPQVLEDRELRTSESVTTLGIRSAMCAPLWLTEGPEDRVIGLVYLDCLRESRDFNQEDLRILTALANLAASKIDTARLFEESLEKRRIEQDIRMAAEIQRGLLPRQPPEVRGFSLTGSTSPCRAVGGDYYDFALDGDELLFALADVSGKGLGAALLSTALRTAVRLHWAEAPLSDAVARINRAACQNVPDGRYIAFFLGRLDVASGRLDYVNAGLRPALLVRAAGGIETLETGGTVLGLFEGVSYEGAAIDLHSGDTLLVHSDGVTETWNPEDEEFGVERLRELLLAHRGSEAPDLEDEILHQLDVFADGVRASDDRTLILLQRR